MENQKYGENESCEKNNSNEIRLKYIDVLWLKINEKNSHTDYLTA